MNSTLQNSDVQQLLAPQTLTAAAVTTTMFDAKDINGTVDFLFTVGACSLDASNKYTIGVMHSDTTAASGLTAVSATDILLQDISALDASAEANKAYRISIRPRKRYNLVTLTETGTASALVGITAMGGALRHAPDAATGTGTATT